MTASSNPSPAPCSRHPVTNPTGRRVRCSRKGLLNSFVVLILSFLLFLLYYSYVQSIYLESNARSLTVSASYPAYIYDDVSDDLQSMLCSVEVSRAQNDITFVVSDVMPNSNVPAYLSSYKTFMENNFSSSTGSSIGLSLDSLGDGDYLINFSDGTFYVHNYSSPSSNWAAFASNSTSTGVTKIVFMLNASGTRNNQTAWSWEPGGDVNVTIIYRDGSGSLTDSGMLFSTGNKVYSFELSAGNISIRFGNVSSNSPGSYIISETGGVPLAYSVSIIRTQPQVLSYSFDAYLNFSQVDVARSGPILIGNS